MYFNTFGQQIHTLFSFSDRRLESINVRIKDFVTNCMTKWHLKYIYRNHSHSSVLSDRKKSFPDNHNNQNNTNLWYDDYYKDYYHYNSERIYHEDHNFTKKSSNDNTIRIIVKPDAKLVNNDVSENIDENSSGASVSIVEINDEIQTSIEDTVHFANVRTINHLNYTEKAIDVPEEFEKKSYEASARNELSPFVRNLQPSSQVHIDSLMN